MTSGRIRVDDPRIDQAIAALHSLILARYPAASFDVFYRDDREGIRLRATVDIEDTDEVMDLIMDKLYKIQVEQQLPVYVVTAQPPERVARRLRDRPRHGSPPAALLRIVTG